MTCHGQSTCSYWVNRIRWCSTNLPMIFNSPIPGLMLRKFGRTGQLNDRICFNWMRFVADCRLTLPGFWMNYSLSVPTALSSISDSARRRVRLGMNMNELILRPLNIPFIEPHLSVAETWANPMALYLKFLACPPIPLVSRDLLHFRWCMKCCADVIWLKGGY